MKSNAIIRIVIWSIVLVFLVGVLVAFVAEERYLSDYTISASPMPTEAVAFLEPEAGDPVETVAVATPVKSLPNEETLVVDGRNIDGIEIEWAAGDITILPKDVEEITISESDVKDEKYAMRWHMDDRTLEIDFCEEDLMSGFGISFGADIHKDLYIYVPMDWDCRSLEIDAASATVEISDMTIGQLDLDGADGIVRLDNCDIRDLDIDTASGDVIFSGTLDTLDFDAASASFTGEFYNTPSRIDMDSMDGNLDIALPEDCGFALSMDGMDKSFHSGFYGTENRNGIHTYGDGRCRIKVDGMSCDVTIRKGESKPVEETEATIAPTEETTP